MIEFFIDKTNGVDIIVNQDGKFSSFDENHKMVSELYNVVKNNYSEAFNALDDLYGKAFFFKYHTVRRFIKCNFSKHDEKPDIDLNGFFNTEFVQCPMRGECRHEDIICNAKINKVLSEREIEVVKLIAQGLTDSMIADKLFISINTAKNHRKNIQFKTNTNNTAALIGYVKDRNII